MTSRPAQQLLPPARTDATPYRIVVVCLGNICRSPMAAVVLTEKLRRAGLSGRVEVASAGTGDWHVGLPIDRRAAVVLTAHGYDGSLHRAQQFRAGWLDDVDLVLAMDRDNHATVAAMGDPSRVRMFRDFDPRAHDEDREVPDPYYGGDDGFDVVLSMVERTAETLVHELGARSEVRD